MEHKLCGQCGRGKPLDEFYKRVMSPDGLAATCKQCADVIAKEWADKNPDKRFEIRRQSHLRRKFGLTLQQYNELLEKQNNSCAVCERHRSEFNKEFAVDHNHKTGEVRGLLCTNCNYRLVARHDNGNLLRRIADYIEQGSGWFVPEQSKKRKRKKRG